jgi:hypothetical protein
MRIFLSHSSRQKPLVREMKRYLPDHINAWIDEKDLLVGGKSRSSMTVSSFPRYLGVILRYSKLLLENFESNPFLRAFYENPSANAFETEFSFLLLHFHQLKSHVCAVANSEVISDFHLAKDLLYAATVVFPTPKQPSIAISIGLLSALRNATRRTALAASSGATICSLPRFRRVLCGDGVSWRPAMPVRNAVTVHKTLGFELSQWREGCQG